MSKAGLTGLDVTTNPANCRVFYFGSCELAYQHRVALTPGGYILAIAFPANSISWQ